MSESNNSCHFEMTSSVILPDAWKKSLELPAAGAVVDFEGRVRDHNEGKAVDRLEYEAYPVLANKEGLAILREALARFEILGLTAIHRTGLLEIGDLAVWVGVSARHRGPAFDACRYVIDALKARVPIWKQEHYSDGGKEWVRCHHTSR